MLALVGNVCPEGPSVSNATTLVPPHTITSEAELDALYAAPTAPSVAKEIVRLNAPYRAMIEASPFCTLASIGPQGLDASPRGDGAGFVQVVDDWTLALPDRRGNNRIDTLRNVVRDPRVALLFLIPGCNETLRVNGRARISTDPDLLASFAVDGKAPVTVLVIAIDAVFFQCGRAVLRSGLWSPEAHVDRSTLPSAGAMLRATSEDFDAKNYDRALPARQRATLY